MTHTSGCRMKSEKASIFISRHVRLILTKSWIECYMNNRESHGREELFIHTFKRRKTKVRRESFFAIFKSQLYYFYIFLLAKGKHLKFCDLVVFSKYLFIVWSNCLLSQWFFLISFINGKCQWAVMEHHVGWNVDECFWFNSSFCAVATLT